MKVEINRGERMLTFTAEDAAMWDTVNGPVIKLAGYTSGSVYRDGIANPVFLACSGLVPDGAAGTAPHRGLMNLSDGSAIPALVVNDTEWSMLPYEYFFFRAIQLVGVAPTGNQELKVYMQG